MAGLLYGYRMYMISVRTKKKEQRAVAYMLQFVEWDTCAQLATEVIDHMLGRLTDERE